ncbi:hypothetical protein Cgig2_030330 [Carnegiea gigantea]|uniref:Uncharacterized protein n=1 Tax=Carnegiea gigantea TaxID=171969 RepID=A0A9Q1GVK7_9CARY|nr:hypothetical protein Cgig2_030330 [Carnegiea gigantea]
MLSNAIFFSLFSNLPRIEIQIVHHLCASTWKMQHHFVVDRLKPSPPIPPTLPIHHSRDGAWVYTPSFSWLSWNFQRALGRSGVWKDEGGRRQSIDAFVDGAWCGVREMKRSREDVFMGPEPQLKRPQPFASYPDPATASPAVPPTLPTPHLGSGAWVCADRWFGRRMEEEDIRNTPSSAARVDPPELV